MEQEEQKTLRIPPEKACKDDMVCVRMAHMSLTAAKLESTSDIPLGITVSTYTWEVGAVNISSYM